MQCYELNSRVEKDQKHSEVTTNMYIFSYCKIYSWDAFKNLVFTNPELSFCICFFAKYFGFFDKEECVFWHFFSIFIFSISFEEINTSSKFDEKEIWLCENKIRETQYDEQISIFQISSEWIFQKTSFFRTEIRLQKGFGPIVAYSGASILSS